MKENDFLSWIAEQIPSAAAVTIPIGDDMAAVRQTAGSNPATVLLKIDQCLDGVHFDLRRHSVAAAGRKAVNRCLSDCAAMACLPAAILLSVALPKEADEAFARELFLACRDAAGVFDCPLVGGDTGVWDQRLAITVAAMGFADRSPVRRSGAQLGDAICVTGALGGSILGRHLDFTPRIREARALTALADIHAMMDLSDGLAMDLPRLCALSNIGGTITLAQLPIHPDAHRLAQTAGGTPASHALGDGEDYELLFTLDEASWKKLQHAWPSDATPLTRIGTISSEPLTLIDEHALPQPWPNTGWEHQT